MREVTKEVCAQCIGILYSDHMRYMPLSITQNEEKTVRSNWNPYEVVLVIMEGGKVMHPSTLEGYSLAITTINGTAYCGWHASLKIQGKIK